MSNLNSDQNPSKDDLCTELDPQPNYNPSDNAEVLKILQETANILNVFIENSGSRSLEKWESLENSDSSVSDVNQNCDISFKLQHETAEAEKCESTNSEETSQHEDKELSDHCEISATENISLIEPTVSTLERQILLRGETFDNKKSKILQLPLEVIPISPSHCEREIMGDDIANTATHILCECDQPGVTGGAVPIVTSLVVPETTAKINDDETSTPVSKTALSVTDSSRDSRPSRIPKLSTSLENKKSNKLGRTGKSECLVSPVSPDETNEEAKPQRNICFKSDHLLESEIPTREYENDNGTQQKNEDMEQANSENEQFNRDKRYKKVAYEFSKQVSRLAQEASTLLEDATTSTQLVAVDNLYKQIINLKRIANELKAISSKTNTETLDRSMNMEENQLKAPSTSKDTTKTKSKENSRVYIKFAPNKLAVKKRKSCNTTQTDLEGFISETSSNEEKCPKEVDSMYGIFIPSFDEPPQMEDEDDDDDEDGLDITIRFPELEKTLNHEDDSHLSVCFSNISAEALGKLKRCPKDFTLRMDFIQGKMFFQSGRSPANNFSIGRDLKITECFIDSKKSDVINIKSSTECLYASQIIPVDTSTRNGSLDILKSTDFELFDVVNSPCMNKRTSVDTKSCITFKSLRRVSSESFLPDRTYYKSMPQIPSLTKILEEPALESVVNNNRAGMAILEKKPRSRIQQKKWTTASLGNILYDAP